MMNIKNCKLSFKCSRSWDELKPTTDLTVKFCDECKNDVHLCLTQKEYDDATQKGWCVALPNKIYVPGDSEMTIGIPWNEQ